MSRSALIALSLAAAVVCPRAIVGAQDVRSLGDSAGLVLMHHDSTSQLTLTNDAVVFGYTTRGVQRERQRMDSITANYADQAMAGLVLSSVVSAFRNLSVSYTIRDIVSARATGETVVLTFRSERKANASETSFDFDSSDQNAARAFADRINTLVVSRR